jgi:cytidylate kinase
MKYFHELQEGVYDPNIFKAFFLAGGPGSGKSYVVRKTTGGTGLKIVNSDPAFEMLIKKASLSLKMPDDEFDRREPLRQKAKSMRNKARGNYIEGRLGLVIDGTGKNADRLLDQARQLEELGYDTHMIFVNTSLDVALQSNAERDRSVPESLVVKSWKDVQSNIGRFNNFFKGRMIIVDNNVRAENPFTEVWKRIQGLLRRKVTNTRATNWIAMELAKKKR